MISFLTLPLFNDESLGGGWVDDGFVRRSVYVYLFYRW
jgi:hypothetical protein